MFAEMKDTYKDNADKTNKEIKDIDIKYEK